MDVGIAGEAGKVGEVADYGLCEGAFSGAGDAAGHYHDWTGVMFCAAETRVNLGVLVVLIWSLLGGRHTISKTGDSIGASAWVFLSAMIFSLLLNAFK